MHPSRTLSQIVKIFLVIAASSAQPAHANKNREDLCGVSVHATDFPDTGNFSVIDGTFTVPTVNPIAVASGSEDLRPTIFNGVALCCGTDCSTRLSVGVKVWPLEHGDMMPYTGMPILDLSPGFGDVAIPGGLDIGGSNRLFAACQRVHSTDLRLRAQRPRHVLDPHRDQIVNSCTIVSISGYLCRTRG
jgi:hypothetical protein